MAAVDVASAGALTTAIPDQFNAATYFVDRNVDEGRGDNTAIEYVLRQAQDERIERITYRQVLERVNRVGNALRDVLDVRLEERVLLLLLDCPEFAYSFFGAMKIGAVPVPTNTLFKPPDYEYILNDSRARVVIVSEALLPQMQAIPAANLRYLREVVVVGDAPSGTRSFASLLEAGSAELEAEPTSKDDAASGSTRRAAPASPRAASTCTTTCWCAPTLRSRRARHHGARPVLQRGQAVLRLRPGQRAVLPIRGGRHDASCGRARRRLRTSSPSSTAIARPSSSRCRPTTRSCWLSESRLRLCQSCGWPCRLARRCRRRSTSASSSRFGVTILDGIGSTEICHIFISNQPGAVRPGSSGKLVPGYEARLLDDDGQPVPTGEIGNLLIKGDSTCAQYWNKHEKTKDTIEGHWIRYGRQIRPG